MDLDALALAVDERIHRPAATRDDACLYGVRLCGDGFALEVLARGEARLLPQNVRPPAGLAAIALSTGAWAAPMDEDGSIERRPSRHPRRWRVHVTTVVAQDGADRSVIRAGDGVPMLVSDGYGLVNQRLIRCWARRRRAA